MYLQRDPDNPDCVHLAGWGLSSPSPSSPHSFPLGEVVMPHAVCSVLQREGGGKPGSLAWVLEMGDVV